MTATSQIGQYRILREIGVGGMGMVFAGEHLLIQRRAAIKTLLPAFSRQPEIVDRFFNEARATSAISDPGIVQVFDFGYHVDGTAYIVMEPSRARGSPIASIASGRCRSSPRYGSRGRSRARSPPRTPRASCTAI